MIDDPSGTRGYQAEGWRPQRKGDLWVRQEGEQTAVFDPETDRLHMLNASALAIWQACDGETTVEEIIEAVVELTGLAAEQATAEVTRAFEDLQVAGLIV